jgi:hypothetical protein
MAKQKKVFLTIAQYANHRDKDQGSVRYAIKNKKITSYKKDKATGEVRIDRDAADVEWIPRQNPREEQPPSRITIPPSFTEDEDDPDATVDDDGTALPSIQKSRQKKEKYDAELAKIKVEKERGKLIDAVETEKRWIQVGNILKTKVLGMPSKIRQRIPEITDIQYSIIETIAREALEELANENVTEENSE